MYEIYSKYSNSRMIDFNRWSNAQEVCKLAKVMVANMKSELGIVKLDGYKFNMITLLMELYQSYLTDREQYIAFHRSPDHYKFKVRLHDKEVDSRYNKNPHITYTCFIRCVDYLESNKYIELSIGGQFIDTDGGLYGYLSRMRATQKLVALWNEYGFCPSMISRFQPEETIILRGPVEKIAYIRNGKKRIKKYKRLISDYPDRRNIQNMRKAVEAYNMLLNRAHIDIDVECISQDDRKDLLDRLLHAKDKYAYSINLGSKNVYRVFNNGSFKEGGRFYGAWWIGCPSILRKYITINGEPTVEIDYSGIHINLLYAFEKINFAEMKMDAYELKDKDPDRKLNKLILLTAYNVEPGQDTAKAVFKKALDEGIKHKLGLENHKQIYDKLEQLKQKHKAIAKYLAEGFGSKLQYHDSCVLEQVIKYYTKLNIPILTVHDSIICQAKYKDLVKDTMLKMYSEYIDDAFKCDVEYQSTTPQAKYVFQRNNKFDSYVPAYMLIRTINKIGHSIVGKLGKLPKIDNTTIKVKEEAVQTNCSGHCKHRQSLAMLKSGKRIFLAKIKIQYVVQNGVALLDIA